MKHRSRLVAALRVPALVAPVSLAAVLAAGSAAAAPNDDLLLVASDLPADFTVDTGEVPGTDVYVPEDPEGCGEPASAASLNFVYPLADSTSLNATRWVDNAEEFSASFLTEVLVEESGTPAPVTDFLSGACGSGDEEFTVTQTTLGSGEAISFTSEVGTEILAWAQVGAIQVRFDFVQVGTDFDAVWLAALFDKAVNKVAAVTADV